MGTSVIQVVLLSYTETRGSQLPPGDVWPISGDIFVVMTGGAPGL